MDSEKASGLYIVGDARQSSSLSLAVHYTANYSKSYILLKVNYKWILKKKSISNVKLKPIKDEIGLLLPSQSSQCLVANRSVNYTILFHLITI